MTGLGEKGVNLSIVIPVWNDPQGLACLLEKIAALGVFSEVIVCDDASTEDCNPENLGFSSDKLGADLIFLRSEKQAGAGAARNLGLERVSSDHVIFFDADDMLEDAFPMVWEQHKDGLEGVGCPDFTMFRHTDSRVEKNEGRRGSFLEEEGLWKLVLDGCSSNGLSVAAKTQLVRISNYPWNKIYRTDFLRDNGIRCSETIVHNDILLHWESFLKADHVLASELIGARHIVKTSGEHLTHRGGDERFCVFEVLASTLDRLRKSDQNDSFLVSFMHFVMLLFRWNMGVISEELRPRFKESVRTFFTGVTEPEFALYALDYPEMAYEISGFLLGRREQP